MVFNWLGKLLDSNEKQVNKLKPLVDEINSLEKKYQKLKDTDFKSLTSEFKHRLSQGETLDDILPAAFAAVREASQRTIGLRHFDVQLMAGIVFHQGKVAEQKTGEGKTLSATLSLYLNALSEKGAHLVTVNDYLASRDAGWMGPIFHLLGVSVGVIVHDQALLYDPKHTDKKAQDERLSHLRPVTRKEAYDADITYGTNNEFGFDYLRDNMAAGLDRKVEMFSFTSQKDSDKEHEFLLEIEEEIFKGLKIPYQVVKMCSGDLGAPAARKYDIEAWLPGQNKYREVTSASTTTDFQSRRLGIKYNDQGKTEFVHTLNGTAIAMGRTIIAILENYQQKDGSIEVPQVLQKYLGKKVIKAQK